MRRVTPPQQRAERERNLDEEKVGRPFPSRHRTERAHRPRSKRLLRVERSHLFDHCAHRQLAGAAPGGRLVTVHEQELIDAVRRGGQEIATEPEQIPVTRIETLNRPAAPMIQRGCEANHRIISARVSACGSTKASAPISSVTST